MSYRLNISGESNQKGFIYKLDDSVAFVSYPAISIAMYTMNDDLSLSLVSGKEFITLVKLTPINQILYKLLIKNLRNASP